MFDAAQRKLLDFHEAASGWQMTNVANLLLLTRSLAVLRGAKSCEDKLPRAIWLWEQIPVPECTPPTCTTTVEIMASE